MSFRKMSSLSGWILAIALGASLAPAAPDGTAGTATAPLVAPAAPLLGLRDGREGTEYANPQFGPVQECNEIERQFVVLNPDLVEGEPLLVRMTLHSLVPGGQRDFEGRLAFGTDLRFIVYPQMEKVRPYEYLGLEQGSVVPGTLFEMLGFTGYRLDFRMAADKNSLTGAAFDRPGVYKIQTTLECVIKSKGMSTLDMGTFTINVRKAEGDDQCALDAISDYSVYEYLQLRAAAYANGGSPMTARQAQMLERIVEHCKGAALRPHAMIVLADYYRRQNDWDRALALLEAVQKEYPSIPLAEEALFTQLRFTLLKGDADAARQLFKKIWSDPYATQIITPKSGYYDKWINPFRYPPDTNMTQWMLFNGPAPDPELGKEADPRSGPRVVLSPEMQQQLGLPEEPTEEQLNQAISGALINGQMNN